ncbi:MAG: hypothetical protein U0744_00670 [Gemmataceae bacterium]
MSRFRESPEAFLLERAPLDRFWIFASENVQPGLIHYLGSDGVAYVIMDDDDERVVECISFLRQAGCPVFSRDDDLDEFIAAQSKLLRG